MDTNRKLTAKKRRKIVSWRSHNRRNTFPLNFFPFEGRYRPQLMRFHKRFSANFPPVCFPTGGAA